MEEKKHLDCKAANLHGPVGIHGTRSAFYSDDHPVLKMFFGFVKKYDWSSDESDVTSAGAISHKFGHVISKQNSTFTGSR